MAGRRGVQASLAKSCFLSSFGTRPLWAGPECGKSSCPSFHVLSLPQMFLRRPRGTGGSRERDLDLPTLCFDSPTLHLSMLVLPRHHPTLALLPELPINMEPPTLPPGPGFQGQGFPDNGHHVLGPAHLSTFPAGQTGSYGSAGGLGCGSWGSGLEGWGCSFNNKRAD